jgi:hypothetical protein
MIKKLKEKLSKLAKKIESSPWYVKIFIGSWVSLYTSVLIWFVLTSWNPALYEGETLKLFIIYFIEVLAYLWVLIIWVFYLINVKLKLKNILSKTIKIIFNILMIFILLRVLAILTPSIFGIGNFLLYGYELNSLMFPKMKLTHKDQETENFFYKRDFVQATRYYNNRLFYYNYNFVEYLNSDFLKTYEYYFDNGNGSFLSSENRSDIAIFYNGLLDDISSNGYSDIYSIKHLNNADTVINYYISEIEKIDVDYKCRFKLTVLEGELEKYKLKFKDSKEELSCLDLIDYYRHLHIVVINYIYLLKEHYMRKLTLEELGKRKKDILNVISFMQENMPKDLQKLTDLDKLEKITKNI